MQKINKKTLVLIIVSALVVIGLIVAAILLTNSLKGEKTFNGTIVNVEEKKNIVKDNIILWDSSTKSHEKTPENPNTKCAIIINGNTYEYEDFNTAWIDVCTAYKNVGALEFVLYADWIATDGSFGNDTEHNCYGETGGITIKDWSSDITLNLNGYKIDRNMVSSTVSNGEVIAIYDSNNIYIKNGCITGGGNETDGGGIWAGGGDVYCFLENMLITGNVSGSNGGGIYTNDCVETLELNNTTVTGNYAEGYGGGVYCDYSADIISIHVLNLYNTVIIKGNDGYEDRDNLTLYACTTDNNADTSLVSLSDDSCIYVTFTRRDDVGRTIDGNFNYDHENDQYFHVENESWELFIIYNSWGGYMHPMLCLRENSSC